MLPLNFWFWFIVCSLYYAIKVCAASEIARISLQFVKESSPPKESNLCLMSESKKTEKKNHPLLKVGSLTVYKECNSVKSSTCTRLFCWQAKCGSQLAEAMCAFPASAATLA